MSEMLNEGAFTGDYEEEKAEVVQVFDDILKLYPAEPWSDVEIGADELIYLKWDSHMFSENKHE